MSKIAWISFLCLICGSVKALPAPPAVQVQTLSFGIHTETVRADDVRFEKGSIQTSDGNFVQLEPFKSYNVTTNPHVQGTLTAPNNVTITKVTLTTYEGFSVAFTTDLTQEGAPVDAGDGRKRYTFQANDVHLTPNKRYTLTSVSVTITTSNGPTTYNYPGGVTLNVGPT